MWYQEDSRQLVICRNHLGIRNSSQPNLDNPSLRFSSHVILDCVKLTSHLWSACVFCSACFWVTSYTPGILFIHGKLHQCVLLGQQLENSIDYWYPVYTHVISKTPKNVIHTPSPISHACLCRIKLAIMIPCSHRPRFKVLLGPNRVWRPYTGSPFLSWRQLQVTSLRDARPNRLLTLFKEQREENPHGHLLWTQISFKSLWETHLRSSQLCYAMSSTTVNAETGEGSQKEQFYMTPCGL